MKKLIFVYIALVAAFIILAFLGFGSNLASIFPFWNNVTGKAVVNGQTINLAIADSDEEREKGLSGRESLPQDEGIIFIFEEKEKYSFWMRDVLFPIDIIFIDDDTVISLYENVPPATDSSDLVIYQPDEPVNYVLEVNAGKAAELGIEEGTKITFENL